MSEVGACLRRAALVFIDFLEKHQKCLLSTQNASSEQISRRREFYPTKLRIVCCYHKRETREYGLLLHNFIHFFDNLYEQSGTRTCLNTSFHTSSLNSESKSLLQEKFVPINVLPNKLPPEILKPQKEPDAKKKRVLCNPKEPCQFMQVKRVPGRNILYDITIPTWCQCAQQDVCTYRIFDFGRRIKIFHCLNVDEKSNNTS
uniref:Uncharacterized protein n=1 Tax=Romanomermis culicivorax TaxID=13658 RepID=A0A915J365_ROMCU